MSRKYIKITKNHKKHFHNSAKKTRKANITMGIHRGGYRA